MEENLFQMVSMKFVTNGVMQKTILTMINIVPTHVLTGSEFRIARKLLRRRHILKERREQREAREREARLRKRQREGVEINVREAKRKSVFALRGEGDEIPVFDSLGCRTGNTSSVLSNQRYGIVVRASAGNK